MSAFTPPPVFTTRPTLRGSFGMVSSTHWIASASAQSVLERGGNAFDAAVAGGFVLHIVEPHLNGPGGDMTAIVGAKGGGAQVLMGQGPAPTRATIDHFVGEGLGMVPGSGGLAAAVPGAVDAWLLLLRERGTWELADVLAYAIHYARHGHQISGRAASTIAAVSGLFRDHWTSSAELWMPGGAPPRENQMVRNTAYAQALERLVASGDAPGVATGTGRRDRIEAARREWRSGFVARAASEFIAKPHRHSTGGDHAGVVGAEDFADFSATFEAPTTLTFRGVTLAKTGAWGQGPMLLQALSILAGFDDDRLDPSTEIGAHTILEALKLALADRDAYYGDPAAPNSVPLEALLSEEYAAQRRSLIGPGASHAFRPGSLPGHRAYVPPLTTEAEYFDALGTAAHERGTVGEPTVARSGETRGDTCHLDVVDRWGNMVAATPSGGWLQSSPTVPGLGFCLGTRLQMAWLDPESPSALRPGARPRTTLTPTMILRGDLPVAALGSPGGDQQDQWQLLYLLRTIVGGYTPQEAVDAPMFHTTSAAGSFWPRTWEPGGAVVEDRLGNAVVSGLERRGHRVTRAGDWSLGRMCAVGVDGDGSLYAAANPRGMQGYAAGR
jgi:gamma-glutamyltranspeptidase/glutathione hydrolase